MFYELQYTKVTALPVLTWLVFFQTMQTGLFSHTPDAAQDTQIALLSEHPSLCIVLDALPHEPTSAQTISFTLCRSATLHCFHCKQRDMDSIVQLRLNIQKKRMVLVFRHRSSIQFGSQVRMQNWIYILVLGGEHEQPGCHMSVAADMRTDGKQDRGLHCCELVK